MRTMRAWWILLGCVACGAAVPPLPSRGGPAWTELKSEHVTLWTDASAARGHKLVQQLELERQVIMRAMNNAPARSRSFVIALNSAREVAAYLPGEFVALAWEPQVGLQPGMLLDANAPDRDHALTHEMAHVISFSLVANQPPWLAEGIATYFEMAELDPWAKFVKVGIPRSDHAQYLRSSPPMALRELFACHAHTCMDPAFYATSWAVLSLMINEHGDQLAAYLQRLNARSAGGAATPDAEPFPELPAARLDRELAEWLVTGGIRLPRIEVTVRDVPATERALGDGDALAARGLLDLMFHREDAPAAVAAALAVDPTNVLARLIETSLNQRSDPAVARAVVAAHPDDWRAWWLVGAAGQGSESSKAIDTMCAIADVDLSICRR